MILDAIIVHDTQMANCCRMGEFCHAITMFTAFDYGDTESHNVNFTNFISYLFD